MPAVHNAGFEKFTAENAEDAEFRGEFFFLCVLCVLCGEKFNNLCLRSLTLQIVDFLVCVSKLRMVSRHFEVFPSLILSASGKIVQEARDFPLERLMRTTNSFAFNPPINHFGFFI